MSAATAESAPILDVTAATFASEVIQSPVPVLVDFWGQQCSPCRTLAFILKDVAKRFDGRAKIVKVGVDTEFELSNQFGIQAMPTMLFFRGGRVVDQMVGTASANSIGAKLEQILASAS